MPTSQRPAQGRGADVRGLPPPWHLLLRQPGHLGHGSGARFADLARGYPSACSAAVTQCGSDGDLSL